MSVALSAISFGYAEGKPVFENLEFRLPPGDRIGIMAPNGSGKTTLFHLIMGLVKPWSGRIEIFGTPAVTEKDFARVRRRIGLLFQDADDQLFCPTVLEDVAFGPLNLGRTRDQARTTARETLDFLGLAGFENRITFKLSGGEKKLVALATILAMQPEILLLDEPTAGLDASTRETITQVLAKTKCAYMVISHDMDFLTAVTREIYTLKEGRILTDQRFQIHQHMHAHPHGAYPHEHE